MKRLLIVGAGGFGREVETWCTHHPDHGRTWEMAGFIDDTRHGIRENVIGPINDYVPGRDDLLVCAIGTPRAKQTVCARLLAAGAEFITFVHPSVVIGNSVKLGRGVVLCPGAVITCDSQIGDFAMLNLHATVGHDVEIGAYVTLSSHCDITGGCKVGEGAFFGSSSLVIPGKTVGAWATVGAGSVVVNNVRDNITVFGNPARVLQV